MDKVITTTLHGTTRLKNSVNGNPRFTLHTGEGDFVTGSDAAIGYEIDNHTGRPEWSSDSWIGQTVALTVTGKGRRVIAWEKVSK